MGAGGSREKDPAPNPLINITVHPPSHAFLSREWPLYLPCEAIYTGPDIPNDSDGNYFDDEVDEKSDVDDVSSEDENFVKRDQMRDTHFADLKSDASMVSSDFGDENELYKREVLSVADNNQKPIILYQWLHNDQLIHSNNDTLIFPNGTLRLTYSTTASGSYRCMAKASEPGAGVVLSTVTYVQQAGKFASKSIHTFISLKRMFAIHSFTVFVRQAAPSEYTVMAGHNIVLNCPYFSVPKANMTWTHADGSEIDFRANDRRVKICDRLRLMRHSSNQTNFLQFLNFILSFRFPQSPTDIFNC